LVGLSNPGHIERECGSSFGVSESAADGAEVDAGADEFGG